MTLKIHFPPFKKFIKKLKKILIKKNYIYI